MNLNHLCLNCFKDKGGNGRCPYCGYTDERGQKQSWCIQPGTVLSGRYIMGTVIGSGGFGITYKAYDAKLDMKVAIKEFYPQSIANRGRDGTTVEIFTNSQEDAFQSMLERFLEEARNMAIFSKEPDIVTVYDYFEANGTAYIVMELIEGMLLRDYLKEYQRIEVKDAVSLFLDILKALEKLHANGIIHKDISSDNIFILEGNRIKLFDFGAAYFREESENKSQKVVIKAGYAPPEQYRKDIIPAPTMDIYAAGALFYEMLTGKRPLEATDRIMEDELVLPSQMGVKMEENLERVIQKALALNPEDRFQSVRELYDTVAESRTVKLKKLGKRKYRVLQWAMLGIFSVAILLAVGLFAVYRMDFRNYTPSEGTTLEVWLVQDASTGVEEAEEIARDLQVGFEEKYEDSGIHVTVLTVKESEYEEKLSDAAKTGKLPDVFCADYQKNDSKMESVSLKKLRGRLADVSYLFEESYEKNYPEAEAIPVGFEMLTYYRNETKEELPEDTASIELSEVRREAGLHQCEWIVQEAPEEQEESLKKLALGKRRSAVKAVAGGLSSWRKVQEAVIGGTAAKNKKSSKLQILPVVEEGKPVCSFAEAYSVRKSGDKNKEKTGMLFLYYMLGNAVQMKLTYGSGDMLPINGKTYFDYIDGNLAQYQVGDEEGFLNEKIFQPNDQEEDADVSSRIKLTDSSLGRN